MNEKIAGMKAVLDKMTEQFALLEKLGESLDSDEVDGALSTIVRGFREMDEAIDWVSENS